MIKITKVICKNCGKKFWRLNNKFNEAIKFGWNQFCSDRCQFKYRAVLKKFLRCENCGKKIIRRPRMISPHNYCSSSCAAIVNNKNRPDRGGKKMKCKNCGQIFKRWVVGNKKYCSRNCMAQKYRKSPQDLIKAIKLVAKKLKRVPNRREMTGINDSCRKIFGTWNKAITMAGLIPNRSHDNRMYKRSFCKANDGHFCDSISELLIDNWLYKNSIQHEKDIRYPETNHKADWQIFCKNKKIFVEYFGLANDSPRYDRNIKEKIKICNKQKILLIEIYPKDIYPKNNLENNLKNKFKKYLTS